MVEQKQPTTAGARKVTSTGELRGKFATPRLEVVITLVYFYFHPAGDTV